MDVNISSNVVLTRSHLRKLSNVITSIAGPMKEDELASIAFLPNSIVIETDDIVTVVKLENQ